MAFNYVVRRLTPRECERLQGFPDDYTLLPPERRKKTDNDVIEYLLHSGYEWDDAVTLAAAPDGPRYRALGNSMAVPVIHWIGVRMEMAREGWV